MIEGIMKKAAKEMKKEADIRLDEVEAKIDAIRDDVAEIKSMLQKLQ